MSKKERNTNDRDLLIRHAKKILNSNVKGTYLARELQMHTRQLYGYRNGSKNIDTAYLDTLLKFETLYQKIKKDL
ncbi:hypothetical protein [Staphylococcus aureus]|uniref:hypothetical protein n=1 Tax=Staphylococcus aureus TaxID=1280 RepID=UPI000447DAA2|nr:hypothetical protein [Staphylococcus aureus]EZV57633.1 hypothetical protein V074_02588 [Staphylococcus aureus 2010-60-1240-1]EZX74402.1 hypothetical protein V110_02686 [Staphylococcus aureus Chi-8]HDE3760425.1 hypothetical protein [Staphylococcus aureus]HDE6087059.1 hypothetical protein [Staphylococcus aureus]HDE8127278.1 hypothetical protein [Staphylococcus aureus]